MPAHPVSINMCGRVAGSASLDADRATSRMHGASSSTMLDSHASDANAASSSQRYHQQQAVYVTPLPNYTQQSPGPRQALSSAARRLADQPAARSLPGAADDCAARLAPPQAGPSGIPPRRTSLSGQPFPDAASAVPATQPSGPAAQPQEPLVNVAYPALAPDLAVPQPWRAPACIHQAIHTNDIPRPIGKVLQHSHAGCLQTLSHYRLHECTCVFLVQDKLVWCVSAITAGYMYQ